MSALAPAAVPHGGRGSIAVSVKHLRQLGGLSSRAESWLALLQITTNEDASRYQARLDAISQACEGCARLLESHIYANALDFLLPPVGTGREEAKEQVLETGLFPEHAIAGITTARERDAVKRILLVLEHEYDFDNSYVLMDLVCLLAPPLLFEESVVYAAVRKLIALNTSTVFTRVKTKTRGSGSGGGGAALVQRRLLCTPSSTCSFQLASLVLKILASRRYGKRGSGAALAASLNVSEVQYWFDRWLVPILPLHTVVLPMLDCMIAGDDVKLMMRICLSAIVACERELLTTRAATDKQTATQIISQCSVKFSSRNKVDFNFAIPKRERMNQMQSVLTVHEATAWRATKRPVAHIPRQLRQDSAVLTSFALANALVEIIPDSHRFGLKHMRKLVWRDDEYSLPALFAACAREEKLDASSAFLLLLSARAPSAPDELGSESSSSPLIRFGALSSAAFCPNSNVNSFGSTGMVFQFNAQEQVEHWASSDAELLRCTRNSMTFGQGALCFMEDLRRGSSQACPSFKTPRALCCAAAATAPGSYFFNTVQAEVWIL